MYNTLKYFFKLVVLCSFCFPFSQNMQAQAPDVLTFTTADEVYLRWRGVRSTQLEGYHVYVRNKSGAAWQRLTEEPKSIITGLDDILALTGRKSHLFLQLFGAQDPPTNITNQMLEDVYNNRQAVAFMEVVSLINPEFGYLLGEIYVDNTQVQGTQAQYRITAIVNGTEQEVAVSTWVECCDKQAVPSVEGLEADARHERVELSWNRNRDLLNSGEVVTYRIYRALRKIGPYEQLNIGGKLPVTVVTPGMEADDTKETHADRFLENVTSYFYYVTAVNAFGFESRGGQIIEATPIDDRTVLSPANFRAQLLGRGIQLLWDAVPHQVKGYEIFRSTERNTAFEKIYPAADILLNKDTNWLDVDVKEGKRYHYFIRSVNQEGIAGVSSDTISFLFPRLTPPPAPQNVTAEVSEGIILIRWNVPQHQGILGYEIERSSDEKFDRWFLLNAAPHLDTFYIDTLPATAQTTFGYRVFTIDKSYNFSASSEIVKARLPDIVPPQSPHITSIRREGNIVFIAWTESPETDFEKYIVYRASNPEFEAIGETTQNFYKDTLILGGNYQYAVAAVDSSGNESPLSTAFTIGYDPHESITPPLSATVEEKNARLTINWEHSIHPRLAGYVVTRIDIERGRKLDVLQTGKETNTFFDRHSDAKRHYRYLIRARDDRWRMSDPLIIEHQPDREQRRRSR